MRSGTPSAHQSAIVHSNSGHCRLAVTGLYLPPAPLDIIYIAPVSYDGEDGGERLLGGRGEISELAARLSGWFFTFPTEEMETFHLGETGAVNL